MKQCARGGCENPTSERYCSINCKEGADLDASYYRQKTIHGGRL